MLINLLNCNFDCIIFFLKRKKMKIKFPIILAFTFTALFLVSCGSSKKASCDAYSSLNQNECSDLAKK